MTKSKETQPESLYTTKQNKFYNENDESISNKRTKTINVFKTENEVHVRFKPNLQKLKKPNKSVQVNFTHPQNPPKPEKTQEKVAPKEEDSMSEDYQLKIPHKKVKKQLIKSEIKTNEQTHVNKTEVKTKEKTNVNKTETETNFIKKEKNKQYKSDRQKRKSTYDPSIFRSSPHEPRCGRFKLIDDQPIKLVVTLKDIGLEGLDSYQPSKPPKPPEAKPQNTTAKKEVNETEDADKITEEAIMKKVQEAWEKRKEIEKNTNTYDPKIFYDPSFSPTKKIIPEDMPPVKLNVELKDIGLDGLDSFSHKKTKEIKIQTPIKNKKEEDEDIKKYDEEARMKQIQEDWELRKEMEKRMNTYDPKVFKASAYSPTKINPEDLPPVKLSVELKDIGLEGLDSFKQKKQQEIKPRNYPKKEIKNEEDPDKLREEAIMKKVQEAWEKRKEIEKNTNTYDPRIFYDPSFSPTKKIIPEDMPPVKLNVELKDIGLDGLDSYKQKAKKEVKLQTPLKSEIKEKEEIKKYDEEERMKQIQKDWELRKEMEKRMNTYDPKVFKASAYSPTKINPEDLPPVKLSVELKDIGLEGLDLFKQKKQQEIKPRSYPKKEIKNEEDPDKLREEAIMKKVQEAWEKRKEIEKNTNTYDPRIFYDPSFSPTKKIIPEDMPPIKLNVELKDIGLDGLDSFTSESPTKSKSNSEINQEIKEDENKETNEKKVKFVIQQPTETATHSNFRTKRRKKEDNSQQTNNTSTYDPNIFKTNIFESSKSKLKPKKNRPIKLNVTLKDIGLDGLDSYTTENTQDFKPKSPKKVEFVDQKDVEIFEITDAQNITNSNVRFQKPKSKNPRRKSTYDPSIFYTSSCAFRSAQLTAGKIKPIKLKVSLKDIGLEGLDSF